MEPGRSRSLRRLYRSIKAKELGRELKSEEHVHHKDGNPRNNHADNLVVVSAAEHKEIHAMLRGVVEAEMGAPVVICQECGEEFELGRIKKKNDRFARSKARFCSHECRTKGRLKQKAIGGPTTPGNKWERPFSVKRIDNHLMTT